MSNNRIRYLDGLRGLLALVVFVHHFLHTFYPELMLGGTQQQFLQPGFSIWKIIALTPVNMLFNPSMAINFFFLLSGFVQSYHYLKTPDIHQLQMSMVKRYFRLALPTAAVVLLVFAFIKLGFIHKELIPRNPVSQDWVKSQLTGNMSFWQALKYGFIDCFESSRGYYPVLWTMPVELFNSWMVLILLMVTHKMPRKNYLFVFWILVQIFVIDSSHSISFTIGLLLCSLHLNSQQFGRFFSHWPVKLACLLLGLYLASYPFIEYQGAIKQSMYRFISFFNQDVYNFIIGNSFLFCLVLHSRRIKTISSKKLLQFFGEISFMFYLTHFLILFSFSPKLLAMLKPSFSYEGAVTITFVLTFILITLLSWLMYRLVDQPSLRLCNRYVKKLFAV